MYYAPKFDYLLPYITTSAKKQLRFSQFLPENYKPCTMPFFISLPAIRTGMGKHIAIISPLIDTCEFNLDFTLRLKPGGRDLSLQALYESARNGFRQNTTASGNHYSEEIPSAGYYLQGLLHQHGYTTTLTANYDQDTLTALGKNNPFAVVVSTTMIISPASLQNLIKDIHAALPGIPVIAGGVFLWKSYLQFEKHSSSPAVYPLTAGLYFQPAYVQDAADIMVVAPHGIASLLQLLMRLKNSGNHTDYSDWLGDIPNLCFPANTDFVFSRRMDEEVDYNSDFTRWDLVENIQSRVPVRTSIGCPYRCGFCDFCHIYPRIFLRSPESLKQELALIKQRLGQKPAIIHVSDDNVFITRKRIYEVCGAIEESGMKNWVGFMRGGDYRQEELEMMQRSGLRLGIIGVESGDQGQLDRMNKKQKVENVKKGIEQLDAAGIAVLMTFVVGYPGENQQTLANTIQFLNGLNLQNSIVNYQVYPLQIFSLSELTEPATREKYNIQGYNEQWSHSSMNAAEAFNACHTLFRQVQNLPYHYPGESHFFNRGRFSQGQRKELFSLRHRLTLKMIENAPLPEKETLLRQMIQTMQLPEPAAELVLSDQIYIEHQQ